MAGTSGNTSTDPAGRDFGESSVITLGRFELRLAAYLSTMVDPDAGDHLVLEVPGNAGPPAALRTCSSPRSATVR